jgi:FMN-dependent NADH-azoreductase
LESVHRLHHHNTVTFKYTIDGLSPLAPTRRRSISPAAEENILPASPQAGNLGDRYLKTIHGFLGVCDYQTLAIETLDVMGQDVGKLVGDAIGKAQEIAKTF